MDVISAISTAEGRGGVAIVRLSGEGCFDLARKMFSRQGDFSPYRLYPGEIDCGSFRDFGMCVFFRAPHSFTGEDVVEFHCHGGQMIAHGVLRRTFELGARPAEGGEFTKRAFLNGKLSLSSAEGMADMINAQSAAEVRAGYLLYGEKLTEKGKELQKKILSCLAGVDADLDYPEEDLESDTREQVFHTVSGVIAETDALLKEYSSGRKVKSGVRVCLAGRPNAGKSSLFNALLGYDRAIVSDRAGTTRDTVEGELEIGGVRFLFTDTAGLRTGADELEAEGIRRAERAMESADLIVHLKEQGDGLRFPSGTPVIAITAKSDVCERAEGTELACSAKTGEGIEALKSLLFERGYGREGDVLLLEERHYNALKEAREGCARALEGCKTLPPELYAEDLLSAYRALGAISGESATESVVNEIFSKFCVGK